MEEDPTADAPHQPTRRQPVTLAAQMLILLVRVYQVTLGPLMGGHCRFHPTCSQYAVDALCAHGALRGGWWTLKRLLRCHPLGGHGFDPVPPRRADTARAEGRS